MASSLDHSRNFCGHVNFPEMNGGISVYGGRNLSKTKVLKYLKVMISKFIFYKKNITLPLPPQNYLSFPRGKSFLKQMLFHSYTKSALDSVGQFF